MLKKLNFNFRWTAEEIQNPLKVTPTWIWMITGYNSNKCTSPLLKIVKIWISYSNYEITEPS